MGPFRIDRSTARDRIGTSAKAPPEEQRPADDSIEWRVSRQPALAVRPRRSALLNTNEATLVRVRNPASPSLRTHSVLFRDLPGQLERLPGRRELLCRRRGHASSPRWLAT